MNPTDNSATPDENGQPIEILLEQEREPSTEFMTRVRNKIRRRTLTSQFASYSWHLPKVILLEMFALFGHLLSASGRRKG